MTGTPIKQGPKAPVKKKAKTKRKKKKAKVKKANGRPRKKVEQPPEGWVPKTQFAESHDVAVGAIDYAIRRGRITAYGKFGRAIFIDPVKGEKEWEINVNQSERDKNKKGSDSKTHAEYLEQKKVEIEKFSKIDYSMVPMHEAERREKVYKAKLAEIKFLEQSQKLIEVEVVRMKWVEVGRKVRDALSQIASRLAPELASETSPHKLERKLGKEINRALERLSDENAI